MCVNTPSDCNFLFMKLNIWILLKAAAVRPLSSPPRFFVSLSFHVLVTRAQDGGEVDQLIPNIS